MWKPKPGSKSHGMAEVFRENLRDRNEAVTSKVSMNIGWPSPGDQKVEST
jgi:hypothetical protein